jgi:exosortase/archaeosortase family protein
MQSLVVATTALAQSALALLGTRLEWEGEVLRHAGGFAAQVDLSCTALGPAAILSLALLVAGALNRLDPLRLAAALAFGVLIITLVNQLRLVAVLWVGVHAPAHFGWVHVAAGPLLLVATGATLVFAVLAQPRSPAPARA